jgi:hypothetical protein
MLIRVIRNDNRYDMVKEYQLDDMIERGEIVKFQRSSGWVIIGVDPIRKRRRMPYSAQDRRLPLEKGNA